MFEIIFSDDGIKKKTFLFKDTLAIFFPAVLRFLSSLNRSIDYYRHINRVVNKSLSQLIATFHIIQIYDAFRVKL